MPHLDIFSDSLRSDIHKKSSFDECQQPSEGGQGSIERTCCCHARTNGRDQSAFATGMFHCRFCPMTRKRKSNTSASSVCGISVWCRRPVSNERAVIASPCLSGSHEWAGVAGDGFRKGAHWRLTRTSRPAPCIPHEPAHQA